MNKRQRDSILRRIDRHKAAISKERDALRSILEDLEAVCDSTDEAVQLLNDVVAKLSEYM